MNKTVLGRILSKATYDVWRVRIGLVTGEVIEFSSATIEGGWLHLDVSLDEVEDEKSMLKYGDCVRGIDVQIAHIVWASEAST